MFNYNKTISHILPRDKPHQYCTIGAISGLTGDDEVIDSTDWTIKSHHQTSASASGTKHYTLGRPHERQPDAGAAPRLSAHIITNNQQLPLSTDPALLITTCSPHQRPVTN